MKIKVGMHIDGGSDLKEILELPDDATDEEIEEEAKEWAWNYIDMWWERAMTNGDKIRAMDNKELNKYLCSVWHSGYTNGQRAIANNLKCDVSYKKWLESEAE